MTREDAMSATDGKLALVTGGSLGIGKAIAKALLRAGERVVITGRDAARLAGARAELAEFGPVQAIVADHSTASGAEAVIEGVEGIGPLDILVNNVGVFETRPFAQTSDAHWTAMFETNVMSGVRLARWALPRMLARNQGRVIFVSSEQGVRPAVDMTHYAMSKAAQLVIARGLAEYTKGSRVTVNSVMPGPTWTEGVETFIAGLAAERGIGLGDMQTAFFAEGDWSSSLIGRFLDPAEPAAVVAFLASDAASGVNGAAWRAEGGVTRSTV
jgi:NAD(P)-dependent dehydrogenase (short-subunit alcohol dehydrogenase family)